MAVRARQGEAAPKPEKPKFIPQIGREYVTLISRITRHTVMCPVDEWERMKMVDGEASFGLKKCSTCGSAVISMCLGFGPPANRPIWRDTCPHLAIANPPAKP